MLKRRVTLFDAVPTLALVVESSDQQNYNDQESADDSTKDTPGWA